MQMDTARDDGAQSQQGSQIEHIGPMTTPAPSRCWWPAIAVTAAVTSGASAASVATTPSKASDRLLTCTGTTRDLAQT